MVRGTFSRVLRRCGYDVIEAEDGAEARDAIDRSRPDLVILDVEMPVQRGDALLAELASDHPDLPVVIVTGETDPTLEARTLALGAEAFFVKPLSPEELAEVVARLVD